jgi:hypothetical protein
MVGTGARLRKANATAAEQSSCRVRILAPDKDWITPDKGWVTFANWLRMV